MRIICFLFFFTIPNILISGPEHDHGESFFSQDEIYSDFIKLSKEQVKNLNIRSEKVKLLPISETIEFLAFTELVPEKKFTVSPRFEGKIIELPIKLGQSVKEGDKIVTLQPLKVGNKNIILNAPLNGFVLNINAGIGEIIKAGGNILEIGDILITKEGTEEIESINKIIDLVDSKSSFKVTLGGCLIKKVNRTIILSKE